MDERTPDPPAGDAAPPQPPVPRTGENGEPVYDQQFFLALARCGKDAWNRWVEENERAFITFAGIDFQEPDNRDIDFSGFVFPWLANFRDCIFGDGYRFSKYEPDEWEKPFLRGKAKFTKASFGGRASFSGASFGYGADFANAAFVSSPDFSFAVFREKVDFRSANIGYEADFTGAIFGSEARFSNSWIGERAVFDGAMFADGADFSGASIVSIKFGAMSVEEWKNRLAEKIGRLSLKHRQMLHEERPGPESSTWGPDRLGNISFANAEFDAIVRFLGRTFVGSCNFSGAKFNEPPDFGGCAYLGGVDLYGAKIHYDNVWPDVSIPRWLTAFYPVSGWTTQSDVAVRLRGCQKLAREVNNHDLERDLFIEERKAERGILLASYWKGGWKRRLHPRFVAHCLWICIMCSYWLLADYGRSFVRPLVALAVSAPLFWWAYTAVLIPPTNPTKLLDFRRATWAFAISNAVPFVGALTLERDVKLTLLCGDRPIDAQHAQASGQPVCVPIPGRRFQLLALDQSIFSALCIFFAGLALRNYFKLR